MGYWGMGEGRRIKREQKEEGGREREKEENEE